MELLQPSSTEEATGALGNGSRALAGGTELVPLLRDGLVKADDARTHQRSRPARDRRKSDRRRHDAGGARGRLRRSRRRCARPARQAASPQLRSMGTIGGNLLQATRCWYWRLGFDCWLHGGEQCFAKDGAHREHAVFGNEQCASAHPSDIAAALVALGATLRTTQRELAVADLYRLPTAENRDVTTLAADELILELDVPQPEASTYLKAMDRRKWSFPIVGVAAARFSDGVRLRWPGWLRFPGRSTPLRLSRTPLPFPARPTRSRSPAPSSGARLQKQVANVTALWRTSRGCR